MRFVGGYFIRPTVPSAAGLMIRSVVFPTMLISGKVLLCDSASTTATCALGPSSAAPIFEVRLDSTRNNETIPYSAATYSS